MKEVQNYKETKGYIVTLIGVIFEIVSTFMLLAASINQRENQSLAQTVLITLCILSLILIAFLKYDKKHFVVGLLIAVAIMTAISLVGGVFAISGILMIVGCSMSLGEVKE